MQNHPSDEKPRQTQKRRSTIIDHLGTAATRLRKVAPWTFKNNLKDAAKNAGMAGGAATLYGLGSGAKENYEAYKNGEINAKEFANRIVAQGAEQGLETTLRTLTALGLKEVVKEVAKRAGKEGLRNFVHSTPGTLTAFGIAEQVIHTTKLARGVIDTREYTLRTLQTVGSTGGAMGGAAVGASIGSIVPGAGTVVGTVAGGFAGAMGGGALGRLLGDKVTDPAPEE